MNSKQLYIARILRTAVSGFLLIAATFLVQPTDILGQTMTIEEYEPKSTLIVPENLLTRAKYPLIDVHNHRRLDPRPEDLAEMVAEMDALNMKVLVNLSGRNGAALKEGIRKTKGKYPSRFVVFANIDFTGIDEPGYGERAAR